MSGRMPPEVGAALVKALENARKQMPVERSGGSAEPPRPRAALDVDALAMIAETFMANEPKTRDGGDRWLVGVNIDADVLVDDDPHGTCDVEGEVALAPETVRRLCCDSSAVAITRGEDGAPLTVTRRTRTIPRWVRRAVHARDKGCRFPKCGMKVFIDDHHVQHWSKGGPSIPSKVLELCWYHHRLVHEGGWTVRFLEHDEVIAITPTGNVISSFVEPPPTVDTTIQELHAASGVAIATAAIAPAWWNDPLNLGDIVGGLEWLDERGDGA